jgi:hypothetical protein
VNIYKANKIARTKSVRYHTINARPRNVEVSSETCDLRLLSAPLEEDRSDQALFGRGSKIILLPEHPERIQDNGDVDHFLQKRALYRREIAERGRNHAADR